MKKPLQEWTICRISHLVLDISLERTSISKKAVSHGTKLKSNRVKGWVEVIEDKDK